MTRLNLFLVMAVILSALYLVRTQYDSRRLFTELEHDKSEAHKLEIENERLRLEIRSQATPLRVESLAKSQLKMRTTTPAITQYVKGPAGALDSFKNSDQSLTKSTKSSKSTPSAKLNPSADIAKPQADEALEIKATEKTTDKNPSAAGGSL
jgi:cell division protein FtsL